MKHVVDPKLDLVLERHTDVSPAQVWKAWTRPDHVEKWFAPRPWTTAECEIDLRPGGQFKFVMRSPDGELFPNVGCYLEVVPNERLVWTDARGWAKEARGRGLPRGMGAGVRSDDRAHQIRSLNVDSGSGSRLLGPRGRGIRSQTA